MDTQDADGLNQIRWPVPRNLNESTSTLLVHVACEDSDGESGEWDSNNSVMVEPYICRVNCNSTNEVVVTNAASSSPLTWIVLGVGLIAALLTTIIVARRRGVEEKWATDESLGDFDQLTSDSIAQAEASLMSMVAEAPPVPDGWTEEAFIAWLQGERPDDWSAEQWDTIRQEHSSRLESAETETDEILF